MRGGVGCKFSQNLSGLRPKSVLRFPGGNLLRAEAVSSSARLGGLS